MKNLKAFVLLINPRKKRKNKQSQALMAAKQSYFFLFLSLVPLCSSTTHDVINPPTVFPTNPTTTPPATTFPPVTITPTNPAPPLPLNPPVTVVPPTLTPPVTTNPVTQYPPTQPSGTLPVIPPPAVSNSPSGSGQSWCVAKPGASQSSLQLALDYACGSGKADCSQIQQGGSCYSPISLQNHASFAFNSYYQKNPSPQSCDFGGVASVVSTNPSTGSCVYQTGSSSGSSTSTPVGTTTPTPSTQTVNQPPVTSTPITPTGGVTIGVGTPPAVFNPANPSSNTLPNPASGGSAVYGFDVAPNGNNPTPSDSINLQIRFCHTMVVTLIIHAVLFH
ncbi:X8 domain-containing protein [Hirschfeldia incana]|nr:X8 domain-containing protein [Hirschfeldia incana]